MAPFRVHRSSVRFILPLEDDGYIGVLHILLGLRFNPPKGIMYVEQEMYFMWMQMLFKQFWCKKISVKMNPYGLWTMVFLGLLVFFIHRCMLLLSIFTNKYDMSSVQITSQHPTIFYMWICKYWSLEAWHKGFVELLNHGSHGKWCLNAQ